MQQSASVAFTTFGLAHKCVEYTVTPCIHDCIHVYIIVHVHWTSNLDSILSLIVHVPVHI